MNQSDFELFKELNPETLQKKFLNSLLKIHNVQRGSIWIKKKDTYLCIEAAGAESDQIKGVSLDVQHPSIVGWVIENKKMTVAETKSDRRHYKEVEDKLAVKSSLILCFPLFFRDKKVYGAVQIIDTTPEKSSLNLDKGYLEQLQNLVDICSIALSNAILYANERKKTQSLKTALKEVKKESVIIGQSPEFKKCLDLVKSYAGTEFHVLITGDSGTGKELVAEKIHKSSVRKDKPFLVQNCSAIPETLLESELFGYKKGAFTGATRDKIGLFEAADGGTVFLDEIGDMPMSIQASLLRVLQENEIKPLGETRVRHIDVRIVAATNKEIKQMIADNSFRQDLFYRLSVLPVHLPPLKERREDIPLLVRHFLEKESLKAGMIEKKIATDAMQSLVSYSWPGNIRELENLIRYLMVTAEDEYIELLNIPLHVRNQNANIDPFSDPSVSSKDGANDFIINLCSMTWPQLEKEYVISLLKKSNWNITWAAKASGINRSTFASRMRKLEIRRDRQDFD
ncbi:MAG: sigma 54-interacting transcriptional regulator [Desulfobacula sp.]|uniref:sigma-54 interaction domain-containing protein n=1 Tax=Desulfobacula sp. TaxID=2593537 RepID=UPI0025BC9EC4|nr:sigma 54-interacting transcriptional regulator [Desulfobacula sp.]MCD4721111.1 sigma 54-interacting transcriptional regulator [Desulfobacula sp.]